MVGSQLPRTKRLAAMGSAVFVSSCLFAGCNLEPEPYSSDMTYLPRTDPLIVGIPTTQPAFMDPPGNLNEMPVLIKDQGGKVLDPAKVEAKQRSELEAALAKTFGRPAHPKVIGTFPDSENEIDADSSLALDEKTLARGSILYRQHCLHCHGLNGDGHGPTATWVVPHPRDYRPGKFKFSSSSQGSGSRKPLRDDLLRTLKQGIEGTSMPSFGLLPTKELEALVSYVIHLSLRGQVEFDTIRTIIMGEDLEGENVTDHVNDRIGRYAAEWREAPAKSIKPVSTPTFGEKELADSVKRGYKLFIEQGAAGCVSCHKDFGRKNEYRFDEWGTIVRPLNLVKGEYRGGRRPIDFYWRIDAGINGSMMPGFHDALTKDDKGNNIGDGKIWDLINFLQVLPYPKMLEKYDIDLNGPAPASASEKKEDKPSEDRSK